MKLSMLAMFALGSIFALSSAGADDSRAPVERVIVTAERPVDIEAKAEIDAEAPDVVVDFTGIPIAPPKIEPGPVDGLALKLPGGERTEKAPEHSKG